MCQVPGSWLFTQQLQWSCRHRNVQDEQAVHSANVTELVLGGLQGRGSPESRRAPAFALAQAAGRADKPRAPERAAAPTVRSGDRSKAIGRELRLDGRLPACSVVKDPAAASWRQSPGLQFPAKPFLHTFVPGLPSQTAARGSTAGVWRPPAGSGGPPAGSGEPLADSGQTPADTGQPSAGAGQTLFDTGRPTADAGQPTADTGRPTPDSRFSSWPRRSGRPER